MQPKSVFVALGVIATLTLGNSLAAEAKTNQTDKTEEVETEQVVTVEAGDTLAEIADDNDTTYVNLFNANESIEHPDRIDVGDEVTIPEDDAELPDRYAQLTDAAAPVAPTTSDAPAAPAAPANQAAASASATYTTAPINSNSYYVGNGMWCTDYVHSKRPDVAIYGNAGYNWINAAQAEGKSTGSTAKPGAVAVTNGHVAYVESVNSDGSYNISEMGWNYQAGQYNERTVQPGSFGQFIY